MNFYCFNCGNELKEIGLGFLECDKCRSQFLPFIDESDCQALSCCTSDKKQVDPDPKLKALLHYDKMIEWAKKQNPGDKPEPDLMYSDIGEDWYGEHCPYCQKYSNDDCEGRCPLSGNNLCCNGLWDKMNESETWEQWVGYAKEIWEYMS